MKNPNEKIPYIKYSTKVQCKIFLILPKQGGIPAKSHPVPAAADYPPMQSIALKSGEHKSKLLILDKATTGLDPVVRDEMLDLFLEFIQNENVPSSFSPILRWTFRRLRTM